MGFETEFGAEPGGVDWPSAALRGESGLVRYTWVLTKELTSMAVARKDTKAAARGTAPLKVDAEVDELITDGAHFLGMTKKDLVGEAVRVYLELRKAEMREAMLAKLRKLDGSVTSSVALLTGISPQDIDRLGGINEEELADGVRSAHPEDANGRPPAPASANRRTS